VHVAGSAEHAGQRQAGPPLPLALLVATLLLLAPAAAPAQCVPGGLTGAVSARLDQTLLPVLGPLIQQEVPPSIDIPPTPYTVFTCGGPFDDTVVTPEGVVAHLTTRSVSLKLEAGAVSLDAVVDVALDGRLALQICAAPDADCAINATVTGALLHARVEPSVQQCAPKVPISAFTLTVDPAKTQIVLSDCLYDGLLNTAYSWFSGYIVQTLSTKIGDAVKQKLPPLIESFTTGLIASGYDYRKVHISAAPSQLAITPAGVLVTFDGDLRPIGAPPPSWCLNGDEALPPEPGKPAPAPTGAAMVSITTSQPMLERAVRATWLAGGLCYSSTEFALDLSTPLDFLAPGVQVTGRVAVRDAPSVTLGAAGLGVGIGELAADLFMQVPGSKATELSLSTGATLVGTVAIDPQLQGVVLDLSDAQTTGAVLTAPGTSLAVSAGTLESVLKTSLLPALARYRGRMALLGNLFVAAPLATRVANVTVAADRVQVDLEAMARDPADHTPPVVRLLQPAPALQPVQPRFTIDMASTDDKTPQRFLRHRITVDGTPDPELRSGLKLVLAGLTDGVHQIAITALDVGANESPAPVTFSVRVDSLPPVVTLQDPPRGVIREPSASVAFSASDDVTPASKLSVRWVLSQVVGDDQPDLPLGTGQAEGGVVQLPEVPEDKIVRVRIIARDEAGNEGEAETSFFRNGAPTMGACSSAGPAGLPALLVLALLRARRRPGAPR
jgi:hypothetical protein